MVGITAWDSDAGYCEAAHGAGDCERGDSGAWPLNVIGSPSLAGCEAHCLAHCPRCNFVSFSAFDSAHSKAECAWHHKCDRLHTGTRGRTRGKSNYRSRRVRETTGAAAAAPELLHATGASCQPAVPAAELADVCRFTHNASAFVRCADAMRRSCGALWVLVVAYPSQWPDGWWLASRAGAAASPPAIFTLRSVTPGANDTFRTLIFDEMYTVPWTEGEAIREAARAVLAYRNGFVMPMYEQHAVPLIGLGPRSRIAAPSLPTFRVFEGARTGKVRAHSWLREHGLREHALREYPDDVAAADVRYPVVVRPGRTSGGEDTHTVGTPAELEAVRSGKLPWKYVQTDLAAHRWTVQELVRGHGEWSIYFAATRGVLVDAVCLEFTFEKTEWINRGRIGEEGGLRRYEQRPCEASPLPLRQVAALARATVYHGFGCIDLKPRSGHRPAAILEVNTRVGASLIRSDRPFQPHFVGMFRRFAAAVVAARNRTNGGGDTSGSGRAQSDAYGWASIVRDHLTVGPTALSLAHFSGVPARAL